METEQFFTCPYCWEEVSMLLDASVTDQAYIEDCEVCCRPIKIWYAADEGEITDFMAESIDE